MFKKNGMILLICAVVAFVLFLISWLVFRNVKPADWIILAIGAADLCVYFLIQKKEKK